MPKSWRPEVHVEGKWSSNAVRFRTQEEALANARDLMGRWTLVKDYRAAPSDDPPNYLWVDSRLVSLEEADAKSDS